MPGGWNPQTYNTQVSGMGDNLIRGLFGNPDKANENIVRQAEMRLYAAKAAAQEQETAARAGAADEYMRALQPGPGAWSQDPGGADVYNPGQVDIRAAFPALAGNNVRAGIDDPTGLMATVGAIYGNDEYARRGLMTRGQTPGKDFALTQGRADDIAHQAAGAEYLKDVDVARVNHGNDIPLEDMRQRGALDREYVQRQGAYDRTGAEQAGAYSRQMLENSGAMDRTKYERAHPKPGEIHQVDPKTLQEVESMALSAIPGLMSPDGAVNPDIGAQLGMSMIGARAAAAEELQRSGNPALAGQAYVEALQITPGDAVTPGEGHWFKPDDPAHLNRAAIPEAPANPAAGIGNKTNIPIVPAPQGRKAGQIYDTPKGPMKWTGTGWLPAGQVQ